VKEWRGKIVGFALCGILVALASSSPAQPPSGKIPRLGILASGAGGGIKPLQQQLEKLGYVSGKTILFEYGSAQRQVDRLPDLASALVHKNVDLIVAVATPAVLAAKNATTTIPIVMVDVGDPVATKVIDDLARPGGNITGLATLSPELSGKRVELLKEAVPSVSRIAVFLNPSSLTNPLQLRQIRSASAGLGVAIQTFAVARVEDLDLTFAAMVRQRIGAFMVLPDPVLNAERRRIIALAAEHKLPGIYDRPAYPDAGGLMSYGPNFAELLRRAATYVDKILKGAKPFDLPVELPSKFDLVVNLKTAKQIGLAIPPNVLARADRVIR
jgi:putative ABC transport system substrate-binding protein